MMSSWSEAALQVQQTLGGVPASLLMLSGVVCLVLGGKWLVQGAVVIARRFRVSTLVVGLTIVALGTSAPELAFNLAAAFSGSSDLAFGNIIGSNIANLGLVLGLSALVSPVAVNRRMIRVELPWLIGSSLALALLAFTPPHVWVRDDLIYGIGRWEGLALLAALVVIVVGWIKLGRQEAKALVSKKSLAEPGAAAPAKEDPAQASLIGAVGLFVVGLLLLMIGGKLSEMGATRLAQAAGMSDGLIGLTIVALATSLPEIFTSVMAALRGESDLAIGNVVGSNIFNVLFVLGLTATVEPVGLPAGRGWPDMAMMCLLTLLLIPLVQSDRRIIRVEGALLLILYLAYIAGSVWMELKV